MKRLYYSIITFIIMIISVNMQLIAQGSDNSPTNKVLEERIESNKALLEYHIKSQNEILNQTKLY